MDTVLDGRWREFLEEELTAYAAMVSEAEQRGLLDRPIRHCPGWTVRELTGHLIELHYWVAAAIEAADPSQPVRRDPPPLPSDEELPRAFSTSALTLLAALDRDPASASWTFASDHTVGFWQRRQPHEHAIHRWDLELALHGAAQLNEELARDGIEEVVGFFWPRQVALGRAEAPDAAVLLRVAVEDHAGEVPGAAATAEWLIGDPRPEAADQVPVAVATGTLSQLALLLWGRIDPADLTWEGDRTAGLEVLARPLAP